MPFVKTDDSYKVTPHKDRYPIKYHDHDGPNYNNKNVYLIWPKHNL